MNPTIPRRAFLGIAASTAFLTGTAKAQPADQLGVPPAGFTSAKASVNGTSLHYVRGGEAPAIILIHGMPEDWTEYLLIGSPAEKIYSAITSQEGLSAWWTPGAKAKPQRNSVVRFAFGPDYFKEMKITELEPAKQVKWTCVTGADEWIGTNIVFKLQPGDKEPLLRAHPEMEDQIQQERSVNKGTLSIFHHDGWKEYTPMFAECNYTWGRFLRSLKLLCETDKGRPWPHQHLTEQ
jgi:uncharacterized protein YndB with AHSA1/START domain